MTAKEEVQSVLQSLPDDASWDELEYALFVRRKVREGQHDVREGRILSTAEVRSRMSRWLSE